MKIRKFFGTVMAAALTSALCLSAGFTANAASFTNEGLTAEIISDNGYYAAGETANVIIKLTNHNDFAVSDISMDAIIPEGLEIVDDTATGVITPGLDAGETLKLNVKVKAIQEESEPEQSSQPSEVSEDSQPEDSQPSQEDSQPSQEDSQPSQEDSQPSQEDSQPSQTENSDTSKTDGDNETSKPAQTTGTGTGTADTNNENGNGSSSSNTDASAPFTGDATNAAAAVIMIAGAAGVIYVCLKKKKATKVLSLVLCTVLASAAVSQMSALAVDESLTMNSFSVSETLCFNKTTYSLSVMVKYHKIVSDDDVTYTRGEWVKLLATEMDIPTDDLNAEEQTTWFYGDTRDTEDGVLFEYVHNLGYLPDSDNEGYVDPEQDIALFEADKVVTREYAAYSAVKALGFVEEQSNLNCEDAESVKYPSQATTALKFNMLSLINGKFEPNMAITEADKNQIVALIRAFNASIVVDEDEVTHNITYMDGVVADELADMTNYTATSDEEGNSTVTLPKNDVTKGFAAGTIFVLPANDSFPSGASFKVTSVTEQDDAIVAECVTPKFEEVVKSVSLRDTVVPKVSNFIPAEGVEVEILDSAENSNEEAPIDLIDVAHDFNLTDYSLSMKVKIDDKSSFTSTLSIPRVSVVYKSHLDLGFFYADHVVDEAMFSMIEKKTYEYSYKFASYNPDDFEFLNTGTKQLDNIKIGELVVPLPAGFNISVKLVGFLDINGKITIGIASDHVSGFQYINQAMRTLESPKHTYLNKLESAATIEVGLKLKVDVGWTAIPIIGLELKGGIHAHASTNAHINANLYCHDVRIYLMLSLGMDPDTAIGKVLEWLEIRLNWEIWNQYHTPWQHACHVENLRIVDACTYSRGALAIAVTDSSGNPIGQCKVTVKNADGDIICDDFVDSTGRRTVTQVPIGQVTVEILATGYKKFTSREIITTQNTTYMPAVLMVDRQENDQETDVGIGRNTVSGTVTNAVDGSSVNASYEIRKTWNASSMVEVVESGTATGGSYSATLPVGYYTITFKKNGYIDSSTNITVKASSPTIANIAISPEMSDDDIDLNQNLRIVLTWGATPRDLDSHLLSTLNSNYHTYYSAKNHYENSVLVANLDLDDTTSYGPETTTIYKLVGGEQFSYYVHDFTNRKSSSSTEMSNSGAKVVVYSGSTVVAVYYVPIGYAGNLWHVFDYDPSTKTITPVNTVSSIPSSAFKGYFINNY